MTSPQQITVSTLIDAPLETVWTCWTEPEHIQQWNAASPDWHTPHATNDLRVGGTYLARMEAKDKSAGFDFTGIYTEVIPHTKLAYALEDGRRVEILFEKADNGTRLTETFDIEQLNAPDMQRSGWQAILDNFKAHTERQSL
ncbi:SRPBCC family protein [Patescibacteria group bacterium]|nr:SRPBCC family protein [Patescibacteria group bacterium]